MNTWIIWGLLVVGAIVFSQHVAGKGKFSNFFGKRSVNKMAGVFGLVLVAGLAIGAYADVPLLGGIVAPVPFQASTQSAGVTTTDIATTGSLEALPINSFVVSANEAGSNDHATVAGNLLVYDATTDPSSATANPIATVLILDGIGNDTSGVLQTNTPYHVVFSNSTAASYYDVDKGVISFKGMNAFTGDLSYSLGDVQLVGTLDDILDENSTALNGQAIGSNTVGTDELGCTAGCAADEEFIYDESVGDAQWYLDVSPSVSGANAMAKGAVLQFKHDLTNPPEGDEYSSITAQLRTGTDFGIASDVLNNWKNEIPIALGDVEAGQSATYRITFSVVEANEDGNDDWTLRFDDMGEFLGRDVRNSVRATADTVTYGGSQA